MEITLRETIKNITKNHLLSKIGKCYGQCLTAVGWVGGTLPELYEKDGMIELSMADVAGGGFVVGASLAGDRPIYVVRYQGFQWYNCISIINYAAKSKEIWRRPCPIFIRSIAMEGGVGPVAGSSHHSLYHRMPGLKIASPMSPSEYSEVYNDFMADDCPYYISEHRKSYDNSENFNDYFVHEYPDFTLFLISITRFEINNLIKTSKELDLKINIFNILWIKPFTPSEISLISLKNSKFGGAVVDDDYPHGSQSIIATELSCLTKQVVFPIGLNNKSAGFHSNVDNLPPNSEKIISYLLNIQRKANDQSSING